MSLLNKYRDVIALPCEPLGATDKTEHHIKLKPTTHPVYIPAYRLPPSQRRIVDQQVKEMLKQGVIQHSRPPWIHPCSWSEKGWTIYKPAINFRILNEVTEDYSHPLPILSDSLMSLGQGNKIFSSLNLLSGYWQVPLAPESRKIALGTRLFFNLLLLLSKE